MLCNFRAILHNCLSTLQNEVPWRYVITFICSFACVACCLSCATILGTVWKFVTYSPALDFNYPLHFNFDSERPSCVVDLHASGWFDERKQLPQWKEPHVRIHQVIVHLEIPDSKYMSEMGIFMVSLSLLRHNYTLPLFTTNRHCLHHYKGTLRRIYETLLFAPLYILGISEEKQLHKLSMLVHNDTYQIEQFNTLLRQSSHLQVTLNKNAQIYEAHIHFLANLTGIKHYMYYHPWVLFAVVVPFILCLSVVCACCCGCSSLVLVFKYCGYAQTTAPPFESLEPAVNHHVVHKRTIITSSAQSDVNEEERGETRQQTLYKRTVGAVTKEVDEQIHL